jgi:hypothetical protein
VSDAKTIEARVLEMAAEVTVKNIPVNGVRLSRSAAALLGWDSSTQVFTGAGPLRVEVKPWPGLLFQLTHISGNALVPAVVTEWSL